MSDAIALHFSKFEKVYLYFYEKAFLFTKSYVYDDMIAEDIVSEALIKLWEQIRKTDVENAKALLLTILKNKALDHLKHEQIRMEAFREIRRYACEELEMRISMLESCDPEEIFSEEIQRILEETLAGLSEESRLVFRMSRFEYRSNKEIAEELGVSVKTVEYHITRALKALRVRLKDYLPQIILFL